MMEPRLSPLPIQEANPPAIIMHKALGGATILVFTPSPTATWAGTAPERSIITDTIST
ncbi:hypothetical protein NV377_08080 [Paenibacillus sp. T3-5-0-4]|nr:hypothetical protein [Paenibacillus endoradicis]